MCDVALLHSNQKFKFWFHRNYNIENNNNGNVTVNFHNSGGTNKNNVDNNVDYVYPATSFDNSETIYRRSVPQIYICAWLPHGAVCSDRLVHWLPLMSLNPVARVRVLSEGQLHSAQITPQGLPEPSYFRGSASLR